MSDVNAQVLDNTGTKPKIPDGWELTTIYLRCGDALDTGWPEYWRWEFSDGSDSAYDIVMYRIEKVDEHDDVSEAGSESNEVATEAVGKKEHAGATPTEGRKEHASATADSVAGRKDDAGKPRVGEVLDGFKRALWAVSKVGTWGGEVKYADRPFDNWCHVEDGIRRYDNGRARHYLAVVDNDPESGMPHEWHAVWCALAALELRLREEEKDDGN